MTKLLKTNKRKIMVCSIIFIVLILKDIPSSVSLTNENWEETFNNSDSLNNWWIENGKVTVDISNGIAVASNCKEINGFCLTSLWRNSTATTGKWSFDLQLSENHTFFMLYFVGHLVFTTHPESGYSVHVNKDKLLNLWYRYSDSNVKIDTYTANVETLNNWMHFDVTRNSTGYMEVYLNYIKIMSGQNTQVTESENINFQLDNGAKLDNVSYIQTNSLVAKTQTTNVDLFSPFLAVIPIIIIYRKNKRN